MWKRKVWWSTSFILKGAITLKQHCCCSLVALLTSWFDGLNKTFTFKLTYPALNTSTMFTNWTANYGFFRLLCTYFCVATSYKWQELNICWVITVNSCQWHSLRLFFSCTQWFKFIYLFILYSFFYIIYIYWS